MEKKIKFIMINVVTFILILMLLFIPMLNLHDQNNGLVFASKNIFGYHFITGLVIENSSAIGMEKYSQVLSSQTLGFVPVLMLLSIFVLDKAAKKSLGKDLVNFLCSGVTFVYTFLLPITATTFITDFYKGYLDFSILPTLWVNVVTLFVVFAYYTFILIRNCIKAYKISQEGERETVTLTNEARKEEKEIQ